MVEVVREGEEEVVVGCVCVGGGGVCVCVVWGLYLGGLLCHESCELSHQTVKGGEGRGAVLHQSFERSVGARRGTAGLPLYHLALVTLRVL